MHVYSDALRKRCDIYIYTSFQSFLHLQLLNFSYHAEHRTFHSQTNKKARPVRSQGVRKRRKNRANKIPPISVKFISNNRPRIVFFPFIPEFLNDIKDRYPSRPPTLSYFESEHETILFFLFRPPLSLPPSACFNGSAASVDLFMSLYAPRSFNLLHQH